MAVIRKTIYLIFALALICGTAIAIVNPMYSGGPPPSHTGAAAFGGKPSEAVCTECHINFQWNNLNTPGGQVEILGVPPFYLPGHTYPLTIRLNTDSTAADPGRRWGFELQAVRASDGNSCGTLIPPTHPPGDNDTLQVVPGDFAPFNTRNYIEHTYYGTRPGLGGPVTWTFDWQAPATQEGTVYFFAAGNTANGNFDPSGDFIFTTSDSSRADASPVANSTWGALKRRYR